MLPLWRAVFPSLASTMSVAPSAPATVLRALTTSTPQLALSAYNIFFHEEHAKTVAVLKARTGQEKVPFAEVSRSLSAQWAALSAVTKDKYAAKAKKEERANTKAEKEAVKEALSRGKKLTGYQLFTKEEAAKGTIKDVTVLAGMWKGLSDEEKESYRAKAVELNAAAKEKKPKITSGYQLFVKEFCATVKKENKELNGQELIKTASAAWGMLDDAKKATYTERVRGKKQDE